MREREGQDEAGFGEWAFALDEELGELHQSTHGHEPGVGEKPHERRPDHFQKDISIQSRKHDRW